MGRWSVGQSYHFNRFQLKCLLIRERERWNNGQTNHQSMNESRHNKGKGVQACAHDQKKNKHETEIIWKWRRWEDEEPLWRHPCKWENKKKCCKAVGPLRKHTVLGSRSIFLSVLCLPGGIGSTQPWNAATFVFKKQKWDLHSLHRDVASDHPIHCVTLVARSVFLT